MTNEEFEEMETTKRSEIFVSEVIRTIAVLSTLININESKYHSEEDMTDHIDLTFTCIGFETKTWDCKARKGCGSLNLKEGQPINDYTIGEIRNVKGDNGWLYGNQNGLIFEYYNKILFADKEEVYHLVETKLTSTKLVGSLNDAIYRLYTRNGKDKITVIPFADILALPSTHLIDNLFIQERHDKIRR
jgi:hypothetical protein